MKKIIYIIALFIVSIGVSAQITPPDLPALTTPANNDLLVGWQTSGSKMIKLRIDTLKNWLGITSGTYFNLSGSNLFPSSTAYNLAIGGSDAGGNKLKVNGTSVFTGSSQFQNDLELNGGGGGHYLRLSSGLTGFAEPSDTIVFNSSSSVISKIWSVDTSGDLYFQDQNTGPVSLSDLYTASAGSSSWSLSGTSLYPTSSLTNVYIGGSTTSSPIQLYRTGNASFDGNVNVNGYIYFNSSPVQIDNNAGVMEFKDVENTTAVTLSDMFSPFSLSGSDVTFKDSYKLGLNTTPGSYDLRVGGFARFNSLIQTAGITNTTNDIQTSGANLRLYGGWAGAGDKSDSIKWVNETEDGSAFISFNDTTDYLYLGDASGTYSLSDLLSATGDSAANLTGVPQKSVLFKNGTSIYDSDFNYDPSANQLKIGSGYGFQESFSRLYFNSPGGFGGQVSNSGYLKYNVVSGSGNVTLGIYGASTNSGLGYTKVGSTVYTDIISMDTISARATDTSFVVKKPLIINDSIGFPDGTWQKTALKSYNDIDTATVILTNSNILNADTITILPAQGPDQYIIFDKAYFISNITTTYTHVGNPFLTIRPYTTGYSQIGSGGYYWFDVGNNFIYSNSGSNFRVSKNSNIVVYSTNITGGGDAANTVKVVLFYKKIDISTF